MGVLLCFDIWVGGLLAWLREVRGGGSAARHSAITTQTLNYWLF